MLQLSLRSPKCYTVLLLFKVLHCKFKNVFFIFCLFVFTYNLCEKYYKPIIVQHYIADHISWVPNMLDLLINWIYEHTLRIELVRMQGTSYDPTAADIARPELKQGQYGRAKCSGILFPTLSSLSHGFYLSGGVF